MSFQIFRVFAERAVLHRPADGDLVPGIKNDISEFRGKDLYVRRVHEITDVRPYEADRFVPSDRAPYRAALFYRFSFFLKRPDKIMVVFFTKKDIVRRNVFRAGVYVSDLNDPPAFEVIRDIPARPFELPEKQFVPAFSDERKRMTVEAVENEFVYVGYEDNKGLAALFFNLAREIETVRPAHNDLKEGDVRRSRASPNRPEAFRVRRELFNFNFERKIGEYVFDPFGKTADGRGAAAYEY